MLDITQDDLPPPFGRLHETASEEQTPRGAYSEGPSRRSRARRSSLPEATRYRRSSRRVRSNSSGAGRYSPWTRPAGARSFRRSAPETWHTSLAFQKSPTGSRSTLRGKECGQLASRLALAEWTGSGEHDPRAISAAVPNSPGRRADQAASPTLAIRQETACLSGPLRNR